MSRKIKILILPFFLILASCSQDTSDIIIDEQNTDPTIPSITQEILELVNQHRKNVGKSTLKRNSIADDIAKEHTDYMISKNAISHDHFNARFEQLQEKVSAKGAGENVAAGYPTAQRVMDGWLNSAGHKDNIEGNFTHIGIAAIKDGNGKYYFCLLYTSPSPRDKRQSRMPSSA